MTTAARGGRDRVRSTAWAIGQCALAAAVAWQIATGVLGHQAPFFAAVAAIICLGTTDAQRLRRVGELGVGVTVGVALGGFLVGLIGRGAWQIALSVVLAMVIAQFLDGGALITAQAALQAILVMVLPQPPQGELARWVDALIGAGVAVAVAALLPGDPCREVRIRADALLAELMQVLTGTSQAIRLGDAELADAALDRARATQAGLDRWSQAQEAGEEIGRTRAIRRHRRAEIADLSRLLVGADRATRNLRVAVRRVAAALDAGEQLPEPVAQVFDDLVAALDAVRQDLVARSGSGRAVLALSALAPRLDADRLGARTLSATVVVAQVRSAVVDLLGTFGVQPAQARDLLP